MGLAHMTATILPLAPSPYLQNSCDQERLKCIANAIIDRRGSLSYMDVARAIIVLASIEKPDSVISQCDCMRISRQLRHEWLKKTLGVWADFWERRLSVPRPAPIRSINPRVQKYTEEDWQWISTKVARCIQSESWEKKAAAVRAAARYEPARAHIMNIDKSTLWRQQHVLKTICTTT
jgi:hypothetical protein